MRERVEMVGGRMVVDSVPGEGTTVEVQMAGQPAAV
jgi:signal transduction histidine kinase